MQYQKKSNPKVKRTVMVVAGTVILIGIAALIYFFLLRGHSSSQSTTDADTTIRSTNDVDYSGPSTEDITNSQNAKKNSEGDGSTTDTTKTSAVEVGVTFADITGSNLEVRAFTPSVIEGTGTCTAVLTKDGKTVKGSSMAFVDASSSVCKPTYIALSQFPSKGVWSLVVEYSSPTHKGASDSLEVTI